MRVQPVRRIRVVKRKIVLERVKVEVELSMSGSMGDGVRE
jgi:hypothetical protein